MTEIDGRTAFVHTGGADRDDPEAVLLIHGAGNDHTIWRFVARRMAGRGHRVLAPDLPGHGKTDPPPLGSIEEMAGWCSRLLDTVGVEYATVVGHSMGSLVAMQMAIDDPVRVARVGLFATAERIPVHPELQAAAERRMRLAADLIVGWTHTGRSRFGHHDSAGMWMAGVNRRLLEDNIDSLGIDLRACAGWDSADAYVAAAPPTLIVTGEVDRMTPARSAASLASRLGECRVVTVPGGSHASLYDHPRDVVDPLIEWLGATGVGMSVSD